MRHNYALLANYYADWFKHAQPQIIRQEKIIEEVVIRNPFLTAEEVFEDIEPVIETNKFYLISFIGSQGHGKSFSAAVLATLAKEKGYLDIYGKAEDILRDLEGWKTKVKALILEYGSPKVCITLDDFSYSSGTISNQAAAKFKHFIGDIRHVFEKVFPNIQIFLICIAHRYHSVPPMLRNSATWIFASMQPEDRADAMKLIPNQKSEKEKLEAIYVFLNKVTQDGPRYTNLNFTYAGSEFNFKWGKKEDPGDGRLMMSFHRGELKIFNSKVIENMVDLEDYRVIYTPPPPLTEEEIKEKRKKEFMEKAKEITAKINNHTKPEITEAV